MIASGDAVVLQAVLGSGDEARLYDLELQLIKAGNTAAAISYSAAASA